MAAIPGKNPEHLVQAHRISRDRLSRGLRSWEKSIALKAIVSSIEDCEEPEKLVAGCKSIANLLKTAVPESHLDMCSTEYEPRISEALELLEGVDASDFEDLDDGLSNVNYWLADIYDYCDIHRIWIDG